MDYCQAGDEFVVWKLDRFGRSLCELIDLLNGPRERGNDRMVALASTLMRDRETPVSDIC